MGRRVTVIVLSVIILAGVCLAIGTIGVMWLCAAPWRPEVHHVPTTLASTSETGKELLVPDLAPQKYKPIHYEYIMPEDQQRRILREAPKLHIGDPINQVVARLGPPLFDRVIIPDGRSRPPIPTVIYYFAKRNLVGANESDPCIELFFDGQDRLENMTSNVPAIPEINWPPYANNKKNGQH